MKEDIYVIRCLSSQKSFDILPYMVSIEKSNVVQLRKSTKVDGYG